MSIKAFFLGDNDSRLFCAYHPSQNFSNSSEPILLCSPIGPEYFRSYRVIRQLADNLSANGHNVLRFDWYAHGDSSGESSTGSIPIWKKNLEKTAAKLMEMSNSTKVSIIGTRFSSAIITNALPSLPAKRIVFWDPVFDGASWLSELTNHHSALFEKLKINNNPSYYEILGFPFSNDLYKEISAMNTLNNEELKSSKFHIIISKEHEWVQTFREKAPNCDFQTINNCDFFSVSMHFDKIIMSNPAIPKIIKLFNEKDAND